MRKAYIILVHKNPSQVFRLIKTLDDGISKFFIHIDKSVNFEKFGEIENLEEKVHFVERVYSRWSSYGLVQCTINAMNAIKESEADFDRIVLLSGQDYPIKSNDFINDFLKQSPFSIFLEYLPLPNFDKWPNDKGGMYRVDKFFVGLRFYQMFYSKVLNLLGIIFPILKRKIFMEMKPFAGSQWWIIDMYTLNYILEFVKNNPGYVAYHRNSFGPDELFFQMIIMNSQDDRMLQKVQNDNRRLIKWKTKSAAHPDILVKNDFNEILISNSLYARKFDELIDAEILSYIDEFCLNMPVK